MKQNKLKTLALVLALALILTLVVGMLVACNPNNDNQNPPTGGENTPDEGGNDPTGGENTPDVGGNDPIGLAKIFSEDQQNAIFGYVHSEDFGDNGYSEAIIFYFSPEAQKDRIEYEGYEFLMEAKDGVVEVLLEVNYEDSDEKIVMLAYLSSPEEAAEALNILKASKNKDELFGDTNYFESIVGNVAVLESEKGLFENHISKASLPSTVSDARKQQLKSGYNMMTKTCNGHAYYYYDKVEVEENYIAYSYPKFGNCTETLCYNTTEEQYVEEAIKNYERTKKFYTDDSYLDATKEPGYIFQYDKNKPGFVYEEIESGNNKGKLKITDYYYDTETIESLTVPAKIDGKNVAEVYIYDAIPAKNVIIEEGISRFDVRGVQGNNLISLTLPSTLKDLYLESGSLETLTLPSTSISAYLRCTSLKTINFDGNKTDFEQLYNDRANDWCHIYDGYDETTHEPICKDITITVVCKDGNLTYPQK